MDAQQMILAKRQQIIDMRRWLHSHPEESLKEFDTAAYIEAQLDAWGIDHRRVGETGVYAWLRGSVPGPVTVLRADTDALPVPDEKQVPYRSQRPGFSHSCGHDMHTAALLGAAMVLAEHRQQLRGEVRFFFQQAEEVGAGANQFIAAGLLEGADRVLGLHADSSLESGKVLIMPGPNNASCDAFTITIKGRSAHVSTPHLGVDALYVSCLLVTALQGLVTRLSSPVNPVIMGVGVLQAGTAYNALADTAVLEGTTRYMSEDTRADMNARLAELAQSLARQYGAEATVTLKDHSSALSNDPAVCQELQALYKDIPQLEILTQREVKLAADDFAGSLRLVPGAYMYVGTHNPANPDTGVAHHNGHFDIDEDALVLGAQLLTAYAISRHFAG